MAGNADSKTCPAGHGRLGRRPSVPTFRPGAQFKAVVSGTKKLPATGPAAKRGVGGPAKKAVRKAVVRKAAVKKVAAKAPAKKGRR